MKWYYLALCYVGIVISSAVIALALVMTVIHNLKINGIL